MESPTTITRVGGRRARSVGAGTTMVRPEVLIVARLITGLVAGTLLMLGVAPTTASTATVEVAIQRAKLSNMRHTGVMTGPTSFAIILTHNRLTELAATVAAIAPQVDMTLIIDNASNPPVSAAGYETVTVIRHPQQPPNLSTMWNFGLDWAAGWATEPWWNVALLCDDVVVQPDWFQGVRDAMRMLGASAASRHQAVGITAPILKTEPDRDVWNRMCGWAFMVAGERGLRADERLHWWWCDTHMDFLARKNGGMVLVPGPPAINSQENYWTTRKPELAEQAGKDGETFAEIWAHDGGRPW